MSRGSLAFFSGPGERGEGFYLEGRPLEIAQGDVEGFLGELRGAILWIIDRGFL